MGFNYHIEEANDKHATEFLKLAHSFGLEQYVIGNGHTLDLIMYRSGDSLVRYVDAVEHSFPDHYPVFAQSVPTKQGSCGKVKATTPQTFLDTFGSSSLLSVSSMSDMSLEEFTEAYDTELAAVLDKLAPVKTRSITVLPEARWYNEAIREKSKHHPGQVERLLRKTVLTCSL